MSQRIGVITVSGLLLAAGASAAAAAEGYKPSEETLAVYKAKCLVCHMADGASPIEQMNFADGKWIHGSTIPEITKVISEGAPSTAMLPFKTQLTPEEIAALAKYVRSFDKTPVKASGGAKKTTKPAPKTK